jgi:fructose-1,6-bisphosphatase/inositol monophosphatase family enzyme
MPATDTEATLIQRLHALEPAIIAAGDQARELQGRVRPELKTNTGNLMADLVTEADRLVQRTLLASFGDTELRACRLLAEEEGPGADVFATDSELVLSVDPIDGTKRYTEGKPYYSTIIGLHNSQRPIYSFIYYPAFRWWVRYSMDERAASGPPPDAVDGEADLSRIMVYTAGKPQQEIPDLVERLSQHDYRFEWGDGLGPRGSKFLLVSDLAGGYFAANPNPYDGLLGLHAGLATGRRVLTWGRSPEGTLAGSFDLRSMQEGRHGPVYRGAYLVLPPGAGELDLRPGG